MCFSTELEGGVPLVVDPEGVVGRLQVWPIFVVDGAEGVVGALIVVVGLGSWLGGPGGSPGGRCGLIGGIRLLGLGKSAILLGNIGDLILAAATLPTFPGPMLICRRL